MADTTIPSVTATILAAVQFNANFSVSEIAKRCKLPTHVVQYQLKKLTESEIIRRGVIINHFRLGLQQWQIYLSLSSKAFRHRAALYTFLKSSSLVYWLAELGGDFHFGMSITVRSAHELPQFLSTLSEKFGDPFVAKSTSYVLGYSAYPKKYLHHGKPSFAPREVTLDCHARVLEVDSLDRRILGVLSDPRNNSPAEMARKLGMPRTTFEYRLKRLEEEKVVERHLYYINARQLGFLTFRFLISVRGITSKAKQQIMVFAVEEPTVVFLTESIGSSDFELVVEVSEALETTKVLDRLHGACGDILERVQIVPVFQQATSHAYLKSSDKVL